MMLPELEPLPTVVVCEDERGDPGGALRPPRGGSFRALPAPSAADALRLCHYKRPDLLLLDLRLPDAFGLEVLREVRASEGATGRYDPELPVIIPQRPHHGG
jgi:CheY-like chemotaxis protein